MYIYIYRYIYIYIYHLEGSVANHPGDLRVLVVRSCAFDMESSLSSPGGFHCGGGPDLTMGWAQQLVFF